MESTQRCEPWNKGKLVGQKPPLKPKDIWAIRIYLQNAHQVRERARHHTRQSDLGESDGRAAKDPAARAV